MSSLALLDYYIAGLFSRRDAGLQLPLWKLSGNHHGAELLQISSYCSAPQWMGSEQGISGSLYRKGKGCCFFFFFINLKVIYRNCKTRPRYLHYWCLPGPYRCPWLRERGVKWSSSHECQHCGDRHSPQLDHRKIWGLLPPPAPRNIRHHSCGYRVSITINLRWLSRFSLIEVIH